MRRVVGVRITPARLMDLLKTGTRNVQVQGVPDDATPLHFAHDQRRNTIVVYYEHPSFEPVEDSCYPPEIDVLFTEVNRV